MHSYELIPSFISKQKFSDAYSNLSYGVDDHWLAVITPDAQICALASKSFPNFFKLLERFANYRLEEKAFPISQRMPCILIGTPFQYRVWTTLLTIPRGTVISYQNLANLIEMPKAVRAVGNAVGANPISPLIPCHRVIGSKGQLGGYYWGLDVKRNLLEAEGVDVSRFKG